MDFVFYKNGPRTCTEKKVAPCTCWCWSCQMVVPPGHSPSPVSHITVELYIYSYKHRCIYIPSTGRALTSCRRCLSQGLFGALPPAGSLTQARGCHSWNKSSSHPGIPPPHSQAQVLSAPFPTLTHYIYNMCLQLVSCNRRQAPKADSVPSITSLKCF